MGNEGLKFGLSETTVWVVNPMVNAELEQPERHARIPARSQRQAMDWSLVLASQDIHPIIAPPQSASEPPETPRPHWELLVDPEQYERAMAAIRQYRLENRGWSWRKELPGANLEIHSGALFWCVLLGFWHWLATFVWPALHTLGRMDSAAVERGAWYRLFTPLMLHSDLAHLMANATFGVLILGLAMARYGPGVTLLATYVAGVLGNVFGIVLYGRPYFNVGASGMMMGALGLLCIHSVSLWRQSPKAARYILSGVAAGFLIFVLFGLSPDSDILAHLGGFLAGMVLGAILSFIPERTVQKKGLNLAALLILGVTIALTWTLAMR